MGESCVGMPRKQRNLSFWFIYTVFQNIWNTWVTGQELFVAVSYSKPALVTAFTYLELPFEVDKTSWQVLVRVIWDASSGYAPEKLNGGKPGSHGNQILIDKCTKRDSLFVKMQNDPNSFPGIVYLSNVIVCRNFTHIAIIWFGLRTRKW